MKKISIATLLFSFLLFAACKKKEIAYYSDSLIGSWELFSVEVHGASPESGRDRLNNTEKLVFTDSTYKHFLNDSLRGSGVYEIIRTTNNVTGEEISKLSWERNNPDWAIPFDISKNVLTFHAALIFLDASEDKYRRIQ